MFEYIFSGMVYPERAKFQISLTPMGISWPELNLTGQFSIESLDSKITIKFLSNTNLLEHPNKDIFVTLKNLLASQAKFVINIYCYINSYNYDLDIFEVECKDLEISFGFDVQLEADLEIKSQEETSELMSKIFSYSYNDPDLHFLDKVFEDFKKGIKYPDSSGFYFYRSLDTIMQNAFKGDWNLMNETLGLKQEYYDEFLPYRKKNAHGVYLNITGEKRVILAKKARYVIDGFISHLENQKS